MVRLARSLLRIVVAMTLAGALLAVALGAIAYSGSRLVHGVATARDIQLPDLETEAATPSVIYAANGAVLATLRSSLNRQPVALDKISPILITAVLDTEDHSFWVHGGIDVESVIRALFADVSAGSPVEGGSTIAQQLVKGTYLTDEKTLRRKVREAVLAERLEQKYSKAQILDAYLNTVYLGSGAYGVQAAAREYFNEDATRLDLPQAALLAGLIQAPSGYDPVVNPGGARQRRSEVLARMLHYGSINSAELTVANATPLPTKVHDAPGVSYTSYGYYVEQVVDELLANPALGATSDERQDALFSGGLKIYTNEVPSLQAYAQAVSVNDVAASGLQAVSAAFAVIDPRNGNVEALVGGGDDDADQFDDATQGLRQPGSGFKLFTLVGALEEGYDVYDSILAASPCAIEFPGVPLNNGYNLAHPLNNDPGDPDGVVTLVEATALSINCAFLRLAHEVSLKKVISVARSMGVSDATLDVANPSLVIGTEAVRPVEMSAAYATVADGGIYHPPTFVSRVVDRTGTVIFDGETTGRRVFSQQVADEAIVALRATVQYGTGTAAALANADVAGKTGTTSNSVDAWFNGITPTLVASVWLGNPTGEVPMYVDGVEVFGADTPTRIWHDVMAYALQDVPYSAFPNPDEALMPSVRYIDSPSLAHDDLISHGYVPPPPPPTTTTTRPRPTTTRPGLPGPPRRLLLPPQGATTATTFPPPARTIPAATIPAATIPPTRAPTTAAPTTRAPTTTAPTTRAPTTTAPTTRAPTTVAPTTVAPTTSAPTTATPTTVVAVAVAPPTRTPTTVATTRATVANTLPTAAPLNSVPATTSGNGQSGPLPVTTAPPAATASTMSEAATTGPAVTLPGPGGTGSGEDEEAT
jgi:membrane peptidoglycan carboxypeptidase